MPIIFNISVPISLDHLDPDDVFVEQFLQDESMKHLLDSEALLTPLLHLSRWNIYILQ